MNIRHAKLEDFEPMIRKLCKLAFTSGERVLESEGIMLETLKTDPSARRRFIRGCHYGYDLAQRQAGRIIVELEEKIRSAEEDIKRARRNRERDAAGQLVELIRVMQARQLVLRRLMDAILNTMVNYQTWIMRRFSLDYEVHRVDPNVLRHTLDIATQRNHEDRTTFSLVTDLTTFVHLGDLLEISLSPETGGKWKVVELKGGKVNEVLSGFLEKRDFSVGEGDSETLRAQLGNHAPRQAARIARQVRRIKELERIVATDRGIDPMYDTEIRLTPEAVMTESYTEILSRIIERAMEKGEAATVLDDCLRIIALREDALGSGGVGAVAHAFFHLADRGRACYLADAAKRQEEVEGLSRIPPFIDLVDHDMRAGTWGKPCFFWASRDRVLDLITGRVRVFVQFDFEKFFELASKQGIKLSWIVEKQAERLKAHSRRIPGSPDARGIRVELPGGAVFEYLLGFFGRAIVDQATPQHLVDLLLRTPQQFPHLNGNQQP